MIQFGTKLCIFMRTLSICFSCLNSIKKATPCGTGNQVSLQYNRDNIKSRWKPKSKKQMDRFQIIWLESSPIIFLKSELNL